MAHFAKNLCSSRTVIPRKRIEMAQPNETGEKDQTKWHFVCSTMCRQPTCMMSANLYDVCLPVLCLPTWSSFGWCLPTCMLFADVCSTVWRLLNCMTSAQLYEICLPVLCLVHWMMSVYLYDFFLPIFFCSIVWCLSTCMMSSYLYDVCWTIWCLPTRIISAQLYDVCLPVWVQLNYVKSAHSIMTA